MLENARNLSENFRRPFLCSFFGDRLKKIFEEIFFGDRLKNLYIYFWKRLRLCPWPRAFPVA